MVEAIELLSMSMKDRTFQALVWILVQTLVRTGEEAEELHGADDGDVVFLWLYSSSSWFCSWNADSNTSSIEGVIYCGFCRVEMLGTWLSLTEFDSVIHNESAIFVV